MTEAQKFQLATIHYLRMKAHWGKKWADENAFVGDRWPKNAKEWRQADHGAPWDSNIEMAKFQLALTKEIIAAQVI